METVANEIKSMQVSVQSQKHVVFGDVDGREKYFVKCSIFDDEQKGGA